MRALSDEYLLSIVVSQSKDIIVNDDGAIVGIEYGALDNCDVMYTVRRASNGLLTLRFGQLFVANPMPETRDRVHEWLKNVFSTLRFTAGEAHVPNADTRRQAAAPHAGRAALRLILENAISSNVKSSWPVALPTRRLRDRAPDVFFKHADLESVALCFDEPEQPSERDEQEHVLVSDPGAQMFYVCKVVGRPRANKRARADCHKLANTAAPPCETRGAFFWVYDPPENTDSVSTNLISDVNIFPRRSDDPTADLSAARTAVDAAGFQNSRVGVWINSGEAMYELEDAALIQKPAASEV